MQNENNTIFDDVIRTIQERHPKLLLPLFNEVFHTNYDDNEPIYRLPEEYRKVVSKVIADSCNMVQNHVYHIEFQSTPDGNMVIRMLEYDFMIGLSKIENKDGNFRMKLPQSCIVYIRNTSHQECHAQMELELADQTTVLYKVPVVHMQNVSLDEIFEKKLYIYLPFYIMRYEKQYALIEQDEKKRAHFYQEYANILERLQVSLITDISLYRDLYDLMRKLVDYMLKKQVQLKEGVDNIMGGKVLPLPSDVLREAESRGIVKGEVIGKNKNIVSLTRKKYAKQMDVKSIADFMEEDETTIQKIVDIIENDPNASDDDIVAKVFLS
ncbi:MAG: hypothetical protein MRZ65_11055 [Lachnospiraceae bacterium]|nr:hypothetical protein [Lachnospiraceae bacterium]